MTTTALDVTIGRSGLKAPVASAVRLSTEDLYAKISNNAARTPTALVVGRVQSGKTLSFTCLIARAADAGVRLVLVLGGTKDILAKQTFRRLNKALDDRQFVVTYNPRTIADQVFRPPVVSPFFRARTHVVVLLKNAARINAVKKSLEQHGKDALGRVIIIDDEADSAGLNTRIRQGESSATYRAISRLRNQLPHHAYVQYTATPQANLLIPLFDHLSPDCVHVLVPGDGYAGGDVIFDAPGVAHVVAASDTDEADRGECPAGLGTALMQYVVGFASWAKRGCPEFEVRSMLVHPSQLIDSHDVHRQFITAKLGHWATLAASDVADERAVLTDLIRVACDDLGRTWPYLDLTPSEILEGFAALLPEITVRTVNSESDIDIDWAASRGWILVGGANLDRGFTIPGLAVTYMPRGPGQGNIDTLQQRGRFFGYIHTLLPECRIHLDGDVLKRYREIAVHEAAVHEWLHEAVRSNRNVREIRRRFVLSKFLRPTRAEVMDPTAAMATAPEWIEHSSAPRHIAIAQRNRVLIDSWLEVGGYIARAINVDAESPFQRHVGYVEIPLGGLLELLKGLALGDPDETQKLCVAMACLDAAAGRDESLMGSVIFMRPETQPKRVVTLGVVRDLLQGRSDDGGTYIGDRGYVYGAATLQVHMVTLTETKEGGAELLHESVPVLALRVHPKVLQRVVMLDPLGG